MARWILSAAAASDRGRKRPNNEDRHAIWFPEDASVRDRRGVLLVVADGMGGMQGGEVASCITVDTVLRSYRDAAGEDLREDLRRAVEEANRAVHEQSETHTDLKGMGATCTAAVVRDRDVWLAHVGDSRAYLARSGVVRRLTEDHSLVAQLVRQHQLTAEQARVDPRRNVVTRSVGIANTVEVDAMRLPERLEPGDVLMLCSDGLHGVLTDEQIADLMNGSDLESAARDLIDAANRLGGPDNVTAVLAQLRAAEDGPPIARREDDLDRS